MNLIQHTLITELLRSLQSYKDELDRSKDLLDKEVVLNNERAIALEAEGARLDAERKTWNEGWDELLESIRNGDLS